MSVNYGSKRIVVGAHYGLRDWLSQRVTAALMAIFTLLVIGQLVFFGSHSKGNLNAADLRMVNCNICPAGINPHR